MKQPGKILIKNLTTLISGSNSRLGTALTNSLLKNGSKVFTADQRISNFGLSKHDNNKFTQVNLADENALQNYLKQIDSVDAIVNCAGYRKSYNYFLSYILSKNILEKFNENNINEFGCRGCIINLVYMSSKYDDKYFVEQDEFANKYNIDNKTIDNDVFELADLLTAARIRCNTVLVNDRSNTNVFSKLITHIIEDQYIAGQIINLEDDLKHETPPLKKVLGLAHNYPEPAAIEEPYKPPNIEQNQPSLIQQLSPPKSSS